MSISRFLGSIKFTIPLLIITLVLVAIATFLEGSSGSHKLAEGWIYHHPFFYLLLAFYFVNILFSTFTRYPFKKRHIPFLITHLGLLMVITGVAAKGFFGLQGVMRVHEGEGSHTIFLTHQMGLFGNTGKWRFSYLIEPGILFKEGDISYQILGITPHGEKRWEAWEKPIEGLNTQKLPDGKIELSFEKDGVEHKKLFDPESPGEIIIYDNGRAGFGVEFGPFHSSLTFKVLPSSPPPKAEDARPILHLQGQKGDNKVELFLPYEPDGGGVPLLIFDTLLKFQPLVTRIPNHLHLHQAKTIYRPGTTIPEAYEALVKIDEEPFTLKMNQVFESKEGYRFYLSNIIGEQGVVKEVHLAVNYDPAKYLLTYPGGLLVVVGALLLFLKKKLYFKRI